MLTSSHDWIPPVKLLFPDSGTDNTNLIPEVHVGIGKKSTGIQSAIVGRLGIPLLLRGGRSVGAFPQL